MKKPKLQPIIILVLINILATGAFCQTKPISLNAENPHYYSYKGKIKLESPVYHEDIALRIVQDL